MVSVILQPRIFYISGMLTVQSHMHFSYKYQNEFLFVPVMDLRDLIESFCQEMFGIISIGTLGSFVNDLI